MTLNDAFLTYQQDHDMDKLLGAVRLFALAKASKYGRSDAESLAQDCVVRIWQTLDKYDPRRGTFRAWVSVLVRNYLFTCGRSAKRSIQASQEPADMSLDDLAAPPDADTRPVRNLSSLPINIQRIAARLTLGYSVREIASQLGCSPRWIERQIQEHSTTTKVA